MAFNNSRISTLALHMLTIRLVPINNDMLQYTHHQQPRMLPMQELQMNFCREGVGHVGNCNLHLLQVLNMSVMIQDQDRAAQDRPAFLLSPWNAVDERSLLQ